MWARGGEEGGRVNWYFLITQSVVMREEGGWRWGGGEGDWED